MNNPQEKQNICPVCSYDGLFDPHYDENGYGSYEICPCCGFQFGLDDYPDKDKGITEWRKKWEANGHPWFPKVRKASK